MIFFTHCSETHEEETYKFCNFRQILKVCSEHIVAQFKLEWGPQLVASSDLQGGVTMSQMETEMTRSSING